MYRVPAPPVKQAAPPDFLYSVRSRGRRWITSVAAFQILSFSLAAGALFSAVATPAVGLVAMVATAVLTYRWARGTREEGVLLSVQGNELRVLSPRSKNVRARMLLIDLADVTLDTRTVHPTMEGNSPIPGLRLLTAQPLPEVDEKRIVLVSKSAQVPLTEAYLATVDVTEAFGKIRVFLRKHGWLPEDERDR
jgi:hypothetical protein